MVIRSAADQVDAAGHQRVREDCGVLHDLRLIVLEFIVQRLAEGHRLGGDDVHQRTALGAREHGAVYLLRDLLVVGEDDAAARSAHGLVGGHGDHVRVGQRIRVLSAGHQASDVGHIHHQVGADAVGDVSELREINDPGISGSAGDDHLRLVLLRFFPHVIIVDQPGLLVNAVKYGIVHLPGEARLASVGQMAAAAEVHAEDRISGLAESQIDTEVCLGSAVSLHVCETCGEDLLRALNADALRNVHELASAVVPASRIAFRVLVGQDAAHGGHDFRADQVLGGDQLKVVLLSLQFQ